MNRDLAVTRVALEGLLGRKLRTVLTAIAIVLGVAMVSGTFVLTDSIDKAFNSIFTDVRKGSDVVVTGKAATSTNRRLDRADVASVAPAEGARRCSDVAAAEGGVGGDAQLIGADGKAIVYGGAPNLGFSIANGASRFNPLSLVDGTWPHGDEVVIDTVDREQEALRRSATRSASRRRGRSCRLKISGIVKFGTASRPSAARRSPASTCRRRSASSTSRASSTRSTIAAKPGVSDRAARGRRSQTILPPNAQVRTGGAAGRPRTRRTPTRSSRSCAASCSRSAASRSSSAAS